MSTQPPGQPQEQARQSPPWSAQQPAPAPWFLGQPGPPPVPGAVPGWPQPPMPAPNGDQANWPDQAPGTRPEHPSGDGQDPAAPPTSPGVPPWTGTPPANPEQPTGRPSPWGDPNRDSPGGPPQPDQRPASGQRREEPGRRPVLDLRTRWARGLAFGGASCTLITVLTGYESFPSWLIGAAVGLCMSLTALWFGAFAQHKAVREQRKAPEALAAIVWSAISTLISVSVVAFSLICYPVLKQYSDCMRSANSIAAQNVCQNQLDNSPLLRR